LAGKAVPGLYEDYGRLARLRSPVGYWNALALVMVFGVPVALWAASSGRHSRIVRAGSVVGLYALGIALVLTYSRGGLLTALVALGCWFALTRERFESLVALVGAGVPAVVVCGVALLLAGIAQDGQAPSVRVHDGAVFAVVLPLGGTGAGSFEVVHRKFRDSNVDVRETHNVPLQFASETGIVGLALWAGAMAAGLVGAWRALGRLAGDEREAALALGIALPAFL